MLLLVTTLVLRINTGGGNVGIGGLSLTAASTGNNNTAVGFQGLKIYDNSV
jgi:hypothetical protein